MGLRRVIARIRARIEAGTLPSTDPATVDAGYGSDKSCSRCRKRISPSEIEYEFRAGQATFRLHLACYRAWVASLRQRADSHVRPVPRASGGTAARG